MLLITVQLEKNILLLQPLFKASVRWRAPSFVGGAWTGERRPRELLCIQPIRTHLRVVLKGKNKDYFKTPTRLACKNAVVWINHGLEL